MKRSPMTRAMMLVLTLVLVCTSVLAVPQTAEAASKPTQITLSAKKRTLYVEKSFKLTVASVKPAKASKAVTYKSSNTKVATVNASGVVTGHKVGSATITVTSKSNKKVTAKCKVTVKQQVESIRISNAVRKKVAVRKGKTLTLKAVVKPTNAADLGVTYKVSNPKIATVNANGKIKAKAYGKTRLAIRSKDGQEKTSVMVFVPKVVVKSVSVNVTKKTMNVGKSFRLKAKVKPEKASVKAVSYKSSNTKVATVAELGTVKAVGPGKAVITATTLDGKKKAKCTITVNPIKVKTVTLVPESQKLVVGQQFTVSAKVAPTNATNKALTWKSSNTKVVTIDQSGRATAVAAGEANITATAKDGSGKVGTCKVTVEEKCDKVLIKTIDITAEELTSNELEVGKSTTLTATITLEDGTVVSKADMADYPLTWWVSDRPEVANVDLNGKVTALKEGTAHINALAKDGSEVIGTFVLKVVAAEQPPVSAPVITLNDASAMNLPVNGEGERTWTVTENAAVQWTSSDSAIATVTQANGVITVKGVAQGTATITGTVEGGEPVSFKVNVFTIALNETEISMKANSQGVTLQANVQPGSAADLVTVTWASETTSNVGADAVTVDNGLGLVKPAQTPATYIPNLANPRTATVTATAKVGDVVVGTAACNVTVIDEQNAAVSDEFTFGYKLDKDVVAYRVVYTDGNGSEENVEVSKEDVEADLATFASKLNTWTWDNNFLERYWDKIDADTLKQSSAILGSLLLADDLTVTNIDSNKKQITFRGRTVTMERIDGEETDSLIFTEGSRKVYVNNIQANVVGNDVVFRAQVNNSPASPGADIMLSISKDASSVRMHRIVSGAENLLASVTQTDSSYDVQVNKTYYSEILNKIGTEYDILSQVQIFNVYN